MNPGCDGRGAAGEPATGLRARIAVVRLLLLLAFGLLSIRLVGLAGDEGAAARARSAAQARAFVESVPPPGPILDAEGVALAVSVPSPSVWADPRGVPDKAEAARLLADVLDSPQTGIEERLSRPGSFVWIRRHVSAAVADRVRALGLHGVGVRREFLRAYPQGPLLGPTLGFAGTECQGLSGLERALLPGLAGAPSRSPALRDARGRLLADPDAPPREPAEGPAAILTIRGRIQRIAEEELAAAAGKHRPKGMVAIALDPATGEILALAVHPGIDPRRPMDGPGSAFVNPASGMTFEPGSVFKPFVAAAALDAGTVSPATRFFCHNGAWDTGRGRVLHDSHGRGGDDHLAVAEIIAKSSNIGIAQVGLTIPRQLPGALRRFGFGRRTDAGLPGEEAGKVPAGDRWGFFTMTSVPMGQEIAVTPLQLARGFACFANGGVLVAPRLVREIRGPDGRSVPWRPAEPPRRVIQEKTAREVAAMLEAVVTEGTGKKAAVPGVRVAGKTGTAQKAGPGGYSHTKFVASFCGFAPVEAPRLLVLVVADEPTSGYYGGEVSAPVVGRILERALPLTAPDLSLASTPAP